jgi:hypothetical protein
MLWETFERRRVSPTHFTIVSNAKSVKIQNADGNILLSQKWSFDCGQNMKLKTLKSLA